MSNPILVEAIETEFVPMLVYNNRKGVDAQLLKKFGEPSWNNPVVRYLNANEKDVVPRKDGIWTTEATASRMVAALKAAKRKVPFYLQSMVSGASEKKETATFAMHCYWEGEARLGSIEGVVSTRAGWLSGLEVVTIEYLPAVVDYDKLVRTANTMKCTSRVFAHSSKQLDVARSIVGSKAVPFPKGKSTRDAKASDQKYYLAQTALIHLPITELQASRLNGLVQKGDQQGIDQILSSRQKALLRQLVSATRKTRGRFEDLKYPRKATGLAKYQQDLMARISLVNRQ